MEKKIHNFGEQQYESGCEVWQTPKFLQARQKAIEMIDCGKYGLADSDFWILMNKTRSGKMAYSGLIISHNGCLKINDALDPSKRFDPHCVTKDINDYGGSLTFTYVDDEIYEIGEVSQANCRNAYPLAMAYKRCFDRVVLKKSKLAYSGVYSEEESEEFAYQQDQQIQSHENYPVEPVTVQNSAVITSPMMSQQKTPSVPVAGGAVMLQPEAKVSMTVQDALDYSPTSGIMKNHSWNQIVSAAKSVERTQRTLMFYANSMTGADAQSAKVILDALSRKEISIVLQQQ